MMKCRKQQGETQWNEQVYINTHCAMQVRIYWYVSVAEAQSSHVQAVTVNPVHSCDEVLR